MAQPAPLPSQDSNFASRLFHGAGEDYDRISSALSFGQYEVWQDTLVAALQKAGVTRDHHILDVATGTGKISARLVAETGCTITGLDLTRDMLMRAAKKRSIGVYAGRHRGLVQGTAERLPFPSNTFDGLTFSYLYRYVPDPLGVTRELLRVVKPGGFIGFIEFHVPPNPLMRTLWQMHTRINLPLFGGLAGREWREIGRFLGPNIEAFYAQWDAPKMAAMMREAGCSEVDWCLRSVGGGLIMHGRKSADGMHGRMGDDADRVMSQYTKTPEARMP